MTPARRSAPRKVGVSAAASLLLVMAWVAGGAAAQEAGDTTWTRASGEPPPRSIVAPDSARLDSLVAEVASRLRCTVCRNQSVLESTASLSRQMQSVIREKLAAGESPEEVEAYFVDKYGEWILLQPKASGMGLLVYVLPPLALLGGGVLVFGALRRWSRATGAEADGGDPTGEDLGLEAFSPEERDWLRRQVGVDGD